MAFTPNTLPFLVPFDCTNPSLGVEASVVLTTIGDISSDFTGGGGTMTLKAIGNLAAVQDIVSNGLVVITDFGDTATTRSVISSSGSIAVTDGDGIAGDIDVNVVNNTSTQRILHAYNGEFPTTTSGTTINWIPVGGIGITITPTVGHSESVDIQLSSTGGGGGGGTVTSVAVTSSDMTVGGSPITMAGTITLALNTVPTTKGGTGLTTYALGDILYASASNVLSKLGIGSNGQFLTITGGIPAWGAGGGGGGGTVTSVGLSSSGGIVQSGTTSPITGSGTYNLTLDGSGGSNAIVAGDILRGNAGTYAALPIGTTGQVLTVGAGTFNWETSTVNPGNADAGILETNGELFVPMPDITDSTVIVASSLGTTGPIAVAPAAGPITVLINSTVIPYGFTIKGDTSGSPAVDSGKGVGWTIDGGGGGASGITSIVPDGGILGTALTGPAVTLTLTGSGGSNAIVLGDLLVGTAGAYTGLAIDTTAGHILRSTGGVGTATAAWSVNDWYNTQAGAGVNMGQFNIINLNCLSFYAGSGIPAAVTNGFVIGNSGTGIPQINSAALTGTHTLVSSISTASAPNANYGVLGSVLIGNGVDYTPLAVGTVGQVLTSTGTTVDWGAGGGGSSAIYGKGTFSGTSSTADPILTVVAAGITANGIVVVSGTDMTGTNPASGPFHVVITVGVNFVIHGRPGPGGDGGSNCTYSYTN